MGFVEQKFCNPCIPKTCHVPCAIGDELRKEPKPQQCKETSCIIIKNEIKGINDVSPCKVADCPVIRKVDIFRG